MFDINFELTDDELRVYQKISSDTSKILCIITKEMFVKMYEKWILNKEARTCANCKYLEENFSLTCIRCKNFDNWEAIKE